MEIQLPYNFTPRDYQLPLLEALDSGVKRAVWVAHRRSGKDKTALNFMFKKMFERVGSYYYFLPTYKQGRKVIWQGLDKEGFKFMSHLPKELRKHTREQDMLVETINGSIFQVIGTDDIDRVVGTNPVGIVLSEYALQDPRAWDYVRPILAENGGWALFNYTPRGRNHGYDIYELAKASEDWFCEKLTVDDTKAIDPKVLEQEKKEIIDQHGNEALFLQEYYCSFDVSVEGAYYGSQIELATEEGRITKVPYDESIPVSTFWDLGIGDATAIWFVQQVGMAVRLIDYYEATGEGLAHYAGVIQEKGYTYQDHWAPHDIEVREFGTGKSRREQALNFDIDFRVTPRLSLEDGINAARSMFKRMWFDDDKCREGLNALKSYHKEYDSKKQTYRDRPAHDWSSHGADALRYLAVGLEERREEKDEQPITTNYKPKGGYM